MIPITVYLSLGSNLDDRLENLRAARKAFPPAVQPLRVSRIFETPPWGFADQPAFLNQVVEGQTRLSPADLLDTVKDLETRLGRVATFRYGPRVIDIDILFYGDQIIEIPGLSIPHPRLAERAFVLVPLADLAPNLRHPVTGKTVAEMLGQVETGEIHPYPAQPDDLDHP